jgi:thiamine-monophosphate kinase
MPLTAGDDYELCFTVSPEKAVQLNKPNTGSECEISLPLPLGEGFEKNTNHCRPRFIKCRKIGIIESTPGLRLNKSGAIQPFNSKGYEHFS